MGINIEELTIRAKLNVELLDHAKDLIGSLGNCYGQLSEALLGNLGNGIITSNPETYSALMNDTVLDFAAMMYASGNFKSMNDKYPRLGDILTPNSQNFLSLKAVDESSLPAPASITSYADLEKALTTFGVTKIEEPVDDLDPESASTEQALEKMGFFGDPVAGKPKFETPEFEDPEFEGIVFDKPDFGESEPEMVIEVDENGNVIDPDQIEEAAPSQAEASNAEKTSIEIDEENKDDLARYDEELHSEYKSQIAGVIMDVWSDMYSKHVNGQEVIDGLLMPFGAIDDTEHKEDMRKLGINSPGMMCVNGKTKIKTDTISRALYQIFLDTCDAVGIPIVKRVGLDENKIKNYQYNPFLQKRIVSGSINREAFKGGWKVYGKKLVEMLEDDIKVLAVKKEETGSDKETYSRLSGYTTSLLYINYKGGLGTQLRVCCGDTSKTVDFANAFVKKIRERESSSNSIANGKLTVGNPIISESRYSFTVSIYMNMAGYQAVPQFMGELLMGMEPGTFKPSLKTMIIGIDLSNNIVTAPFKGWLLPIIAGSRSGKGVLTLNMLLNVIGTGAPLFYLDGKPDMSTLLWKLNEKHNIENAIVIDGVGYEGITDIDAKPYKAPYTKLLEAKMHEPEADNIISSNFGYMIYLKTMMVILMSAKYYLNAMGRKYGDLFVVFDELYKVIAQQGTTFKGKIDSEKTRYGESTKEEKAKKVERLRAISTIMNFNNNVFQSFLGNDIGVFGGGIKAVTLAQKPQVMDYKVGGMESAEKFATGFALKRGPKLYGRQDPFFISYGMSKGKDDMLFDLYDKYYHFGIGGSSDNTTDNVKTFKPLLVLNECDAKEVTGAAEDGAFVRVMMDRISAYADAEEFRNKYFRSDPELAASIGFEGALAQVGRLIGKNWEDCYRESMERAYEIADGALKYYGIIGAPGISSVYDYICSCRVEHLWTWADIEEAKMKGIPLPNGAPITDKKDEAPKDEREAFGAKGSAKDGANGDSKNGDKSSGGSSDSSNSRSNNSRSTDDSSRESNSSRENNYNSDGSYRSDRDYSSNRNYNSTSTFTNTRVERNIPRVEYESGEVIDFDNQDELNPPNNTMSSGRHGAVPNITPEEQAILRRAQVVREGRSLSDMDAAQVRAGIRTTDVSGAVVAGVVGAAAGAVVAGTVEAGRDTASGVANAATNVANVAGSVAGAAVNATRTTSSSGRRLDGSGRVVEADGRPVIVNGRQVGANGKPLIVNGRQIDAHGRQVDPTGRPFLVNGRAIDITGNPMGTQVGPGGSVGAGGQPISGPGAGGQPMGANGQPMYQSGGQVGGSSGLVDANGRPLGFPGAPVQSGSGILGANGQPIVSGIQLGGTPDTVIIDGPLGSVEPAASPVPTPEFIVQPAQGEVQQPQGDWLPVGGNAQPVQGEGQPVQENGQQPQVTWLPVDGNEQPVQENVQQPQGNGQPVYNDNQNDTNPVPEEVRGQGQSVYTDEGDGGSRSPVYTFITPSDTSQILNLTPENSCIVPVEGYRSQKSSLKLIRTLRGSKYEFKSRWKYILDTISESQDPDTITNVNIFNDAMVFNKRQVATVGLLGGMDGVEVRDIVAFGILSKKFHNIKSLGIDTSIYESSTSELGRSPETALFSIMPSLVRLAIWKPGFGEAPMVYTRQSIQEEETRAAIKLQNDRAELKRGIDTIAAANNPRFANMPPIEKSRIYNGSKGFKEAGWESCKRNFKNDRYLRGGLSGVLTVGAGAIFLSLKGVSKLGNMFSRR